MLFIVADKMQTYFKTGHIQKKNAGKSTALVISL